MSFGLLRLSGIIRIYSGFGQAKFTGAIWHDIPPNVRLPMERKTATLGDEFPMTSLLLQTRRVVLAIAIGVLGFAPHLRAETQLLKSWRYSSESADAAETGAAVTIPHTWNATDIQAGKGTNQMSMDGYRRA